MMENPTHTGTIYGAALAFMGHEFKSKAPVDRMYKVGRAGADSQLYKGYWLVISKQYLTIMNASGDYLHVGTSRTDYTRRPARFLIGPEMLKLFQLYKEFDYVYYRYDGHNLFELNGSRTNSPITSKSTLFVLPIAHRTPNEAEMDRKARIKHDRQPV